MRARFSGALTFFGFIPCLGVYCGVVFEITKGFYGSIAVRFFWRIEIKTRGFRPVFPVVLAIFSVLNIGSTVRIARPLCFMLFYNIFKLSFTISQHCYVLF